MRTAARAFEYRAPQQSTAPSSIAEAEAWTAFWQEQGSNSRCLGSASSELHGILGRHWTQVAYALPPRSNVLDVGCGSGVVGRQLIAANPSLQVVGIDSARVPAARERPQLKILPGIPIEKIPARDGCCDAVVSQFGYEYSDVHIAAKQLARIVRPGGRLSFVVHHSESPIVQGDRQHHQALRAMMGEGVREAFLAGDTSALSAELEKLKRDFSDETTLRQLGPGLQANMAGDTAGRRQVWNAIKNALSPDCVLSDALEASCVAPAGMEAWLEPLRAAFQVDRPAILELQGRPLAWTIEGRRNER